MQSFGCSRLSVRYSQHHMRSEFKLRRPLNSVMPMPPAACPVRHQVHRRVDAQYSRFITELSREHHSRPATPMCSHGRSGPSKGRRGR